MSIARTENAPRYSAFDPAHLLALQQRERLFLKALRQNGVAELAGLQILDVGCGTGVELARFVGRGARATQCYGIDIDQDRVSEARRVNPAFTIEAGTATGLPWADRSFDLVCQFTTFTSILDAEMRNQAASEITRVLRPGGHFIWYDFWVNPINPNTHPITAAGVRTLFPDLTGPVRRLTLAPPLSRRIAPRSWLVAAFLQELLPLQTHCLAVLRKHG